MSPIYMYETKIVELCFKFKEVFIFNTKDVTIFQQQWLALSLITFFIRVTFIRRPLLQLTQSKRKRICHLLSENSLEVFLELVKVI